MADPSPPLTPRRLPRGLRLASCALLLAPFLLLAGLSGERIARDAGWIPEAPAGLSDAEAELARDPARLILFSAGTAEVRVLSLEGELLGRLRADPPTSTQGLPLRDGDWLIYLGGQRQSPVWEAHLGRIPRQGNHLTRRFRLPGTVPVSAIDGHPSEVVAPWPLALRCDGEILLRLERGWARLALGPGRRYRRRQGPPPLAPRLEGAPRGECRPLRPVEARQPVPVEHALLDEIWRAGTPYLLGAPRLPPPYLVLVGPDRRRLRLLRPPAGSSVSGSALRAGRHLLFHGRACDLGELRLTLADLEDAAGRASLWSTVLPIQPRGCRPGPLAAQLCGAGAEQVLRIEEADRVLCHRVRDGASAPDPGSQGCSPFRELRRDAASWEAARTLQVGSARFRIEPLEAGKLALLASENGRARWQVALDAPAILLGATDQALLLIAGDELRVHERASGALRGRQRLELLRAEESEPPPSFRFIGSAGSRGYFLVQSQRVHAMLFDGVRARELR